MFNKEETLRSAIDARIQEDFEYQFNIDNFKRGIVICEGDPELVEFKQQLKELLRSNLLEQKKNRVILQALQEQLEG